jgi:hypothetical protein
MNNRAMHWQDRLAASNWNPETFLIMGRLFLDLGQRVMPETLQRIGGTRQQTVFTETDWDQAYRAAPGMLTQITASFDPALAREAPAQEEALGPWLRDTMNRIATIVTKMEKHTDRNTGFFTEEAMQSPELKAVLGTIDQGIDPLLVELKAALDNIAALMSSGHPMSDWLIKAQGGDYEALRFVLSLNPWLIYHAGITRRIQQSFTEEDQELLHDIAQIPRQQSGFPKHATIGLILIALWEAGLKRLTYNQIRGFLKGVGLHGLPTHQALERYGQRLGLKKNVIEGESSRGKRD